MGKGALWLGVALVVAVVFFFPFGSVTGNATFTNDTTAPSLTIISSYVNSSNIANVYLNAYDPESTVDMVRVYGPTEYTGLVRNSKSCGTNSCSKNLSFGYNPVYDNNGNTYRVEAVSSGGTSSQQITLVFNGEGNPTCTNECNISGQFQCFGSYAKTCGNYDADGCLEWNSGTFCTYGCSGGSCLSNPGNQTNQTSCTDSDGGLNYNTKGQVNVTNLSGMFTYVDYCTTSSQLWERYCNGNAVALQGYTCSSGYTCSNGACITNQTGNSTSCTDSDGGINLQVFGNTFNSTTSRSDICVSSSVIGEYSCTGSNVMWNQLSCQTGQSCSSGRCMQSNQTGNSSSCVDGDGGLNYYTPSYVNVTSNGNFSQIFDSCSNGNSGTQVYEKYCSGNISSTNVYACPNGCVGGGCLQQNSTNYTCTDTDGGINYFVKGNVNDNSGQSAADFCNVDVDGNNLTELFCGNGVLGGVLYICPSGYLCNDGACVQLQPFCTDSDGGAVYNVRGTATTQDGNYTDYCSSPANSSILKEHFCSGTNLNASAYSCQYGCDSGACKSATRRNPLCKSLFCAVKNLFGANKYST